MQKVRGSQPKGAWLTSTSFVAFFWGEEEDSLGGQGITCANLQFLSIFIEVIDSLLQESTHISGAQNAHF